MTTMKTLTIDLDDLIIALATRYELDDPSHYLDLDSGEVIYAGEGLEALPPDLATNPRYRWIESVQAEPALPSGARDLDRRIPGRGALRGLQGGHADLA
jgi:hypothetical protein